jgi:hypothetical protein
MNRSRSLLSRLARLESAVAVARRDPLADDDFLVRCYLGLKHCPNPPRHADGRLMTWEEMLDRFLARAATEDDFPFSRVFIWLLSDNELIRLIETLERLHPDPGFRQELEAMSDSELEELCPTPSHLKPLYDLMPRVCAREPGIYQRVLPLLKAALPIGVR